MFFLDASDQKWLRMFASSSFHIVQVIMVDSVVIMKHETTGTTPRASYVGLQYELQSIAIHQIFEPTLTLAFSPKQLLSKVKSEKARENKRFII